MTGSHGEVTESWIAEAASEFWSAAGEPGDYPRDLERPILWALPLAIVKTPRLCVGEVNDWLRARGLSPLEVPERDLLGCLVASRGKGFVLLDGSCPVDETRFSLAHEAAHFVLDHWSPRRRAKDVFGDGIVEVLDGLRAPTLQEQVGSILAPVSLGLHVHLLDRTDGGFQSSSVERVEERADRFALELLAPESEVVRRFRRSKPRPCAFAEALDRTQRILRSEFGLPASVSLSYAGLICGRFFRGPSFREWIGLPHS